MAKRAPDPQYKRDRVHILHTPMGNISMNIRTKFHLNRFSVAHVRANSFRVVFFFLATLYVQISLFVVVEENIERLERREEKGEDGIIRSSQIQNSVPLQAATPSPAKMRRIDWSDGRLSVSSKLCELSTAGLNFSYLQLLFLCLAVAFTSGGGASVKRAAVETAIHTTECSTVGSNLTGAASLGSGSQGAQCKCRCFIGSFVVTSAFTCSGSPQLTSPSDGRSTSPLSQTPHSRAVRRKLGLQLDEHAAESRGRLVPELITCCVPYLCFRFAACCFSRNRNWSSVSNWNSAI